jgi:PhnB protein
MKKRTAAKKKAAPKAKKSARKAPAAKARVSPIAPGFRSVTPQLTVRGAAAAIDFYKRALGAREVMRMASPDGKVMHAELKIGDSVIFLGDEFPEAGCQSPQTLGGATGSLHVYVPNVDAAFKRAVDAGAQATMPVSDMFWGDRYGKVKDPFGHEWGLATHKETLTPAQMRKRGEEAMKQMAAQQPPAQHG